MPVVKGFPPTVRWEGGKVGAQGGLLQAPASDGRRKSLDKRHYWKHALPPNLRQNLRQAGRGDNTSETQQCLGRRWLANYS